MRGSSRACSDGLCVWRWVVWQEGDASAAEADVVAVAQRLGALIKQQRELQTKLRGIQHGIHRATRNLQYGQRCHDVWHLVDAHFGQAQDVPGGHASPAPDARAGPGAGEQAASRSSGAADSIAEVLESWMGSAAEKLHVRCLLETQRAVQGAVKRMETASAEERHFTEQLRGLSCQGKGARGKGKTSIGVLDSQYAGFYRDTLHAIARERASCLETCSSLKMYLRRCAESADGEGETAADSVSAGARGATGRREAKGCVEKAREGLASLVEEALEQVRERASAGQGSASGAAPATDGSAGDKRGLGEKVRPAGAALQHANSQAGGGIEQATSTTSLVVHPALPARRGPDAASSGVGSTGLGAVVVSGEASSASEACVEYLSGVKRQLHKCTTVLPSGRELGTMELVAAEDMGRDAGADADTRAFDLLVRVVLAGLGQPRTCDSIAAGVSGSERAPPAPQASESTPDDARVDTLDVAVDYCKAVCHAVQLVSDSKVANAVVLLPHAQRVLPPPAAAARTGKADDGEAPREDASVEARAADAGAGGEARAPKEWTESGRPCRSAEGSVGAGEKSEKSAGSSSQTHMVLSCVRAYARARYPELRRVAVVNLAEDAAVGARAEVTGDDDLLVLHPLSAPPPCAAAAAAKWVGSTPPGAACIFCSRAAWPSSKHHAASSTAAAASTAPCRRASAAVIASRSRASQAKPPPPLPPPPPPPPPLPLALAPPPTVPLLSPNAETKAWSCRCIPGERSSTCRRLDSAASVAPWLEAATDGSRAARAETTCSNWTKRSPGAPAQTIWQRVARRRPERIAASVAAAAALAGSPAAAAAAAAAAAESDWLACRTK